MIPTMNKSDLLDEGVSVIVCCHNSSEVIGPTVDALSRQILSKGYRYEVILVDNQCRDDTVQVAKQAWFMGPRRLKIIQERRLGLMHARLAGLRAASCRYLIFVDDDNILSSKWVDNVYNIFSHQPDVGLIGGRNLPLTDRPAPEWFPKFYGVYACGSRIKPSRKRGFKLFGAGIAFRTTILRKVMFNPPAFFLVGHTGKALKRGDDTEMAAAVAVSDVKRLRRRAKK